MILNNALLGRPGGSPGSPLRPSPYRSEPGSIPDGGRLLHVLLSLSHSIIKRKNANALLCDMMVVDGRFECGSH